jgi:response regulator NasT
MAATPTHKPVRVMLVDDQAQRANRVVEKLQLEGFEVVALLPSAAGLLFQIEQLKPEVILIDLQSPGRDVLDSLSIINDQNPIPVVMYSQQGDEKYIQDAIHAGVTAYLMGDVEAKTVTPAINVAIAQFKSYQSMRHELNETRTQLEKISAIDQAKRLLMEQRQVSEEESHKVLRKLAMDTNQTMLQAANSVIQILNKA